MKVSKKKKKSFSNKHLFSIDNSFSISQYQHEHRSQARMLARTQKKRKNQSQKPYQSQTKKVLDTSLLASIGAEQDAGTTSSPRKHLSRDGGHQNPKRPTSLHNTENLDTSDIRSSILNPLKSRKDVMPERPSFDPTASGSPAQEPLVSAINQSFSRTGKKKDNNLSVKAINLWKYRTLKDSLLGSQSKNRSDLTKTLQNLDPNCKDEPRPSFSRPLKLRSSNYQRTAGKDTHQEWSNRSELLYTSQTAQHPRNLSRESKQRRRAGGVENSDSSRFRKACLGLHDRHQNQARTPIQVPNTAQRDSYSSQLFYSSTSKRNISFLRGDLLNKSSAKNDHFSEHLMTQSSNLQHENFVRQNLIKKLKINQNSGDGEEERTGSRRNSKKSSAVQLNNPLQQSIALSRGFDSQHSSDVLRLNFGSQENRYESRFKTPNPAPGRYQHVEMPRSGAVVRPPAHSAYNDYNCDRFGGFGGGHKRDLSLRPCKKDVSNFGRKGGIGREGTAGRETAVAREPTPPPTRLNTSLLLKNGKPSVAAFRPRRGTKNSRNEASGSNHLNFSMSTDRTAYQSNPGNNRKGGDRRGLSIQIAANEVSNFETPNEVGAQSINFMATSNLPIKHSSVLQEQGRRGQRIRLIKVKKEVKSLKRELEKLTSGINVLKLGQIKTQIMEEDKMSKKSQNPGSGTSGKNPRQERPSRRDGLKYEENMLKFQIEDMSRQYNDLKKVNLDLKEELKKKYEAGGKGLFVGVSPHGLRDRQGRLQKGGQEVKKAMKKNRGLKKAMERFRMIFKNKEDDMKQRSCDLIRSEVLKLRQDFQANQHNVKKFLKNILGLGAGVKEKSKMTKKFSLDD